MERRKFIKKSIHTGLMVSLPISLSGFNLRNTQKLQIGIVADVHMDIIHDAFARLRYFMDDMNKRKPDFIIQLGDFALPRTQNQPFLDIWNEFEGPSYHVLGNHDMRDLGFTREQTMEWWQMEKRYYSFDKADFHFIVLDGNDKNPGPWEGYDRFIGTEQKSWLKKDLAKATKPTIVFSHQSLEAESGVANNAEIRAILEEPKTNNGDPKVIACLSGHHHTDYVKQINGIPYIQINSMSYKWVGSEYMKIRYPEHIEQAFPNLKNTCPYKDPLYTVMTLDLQDGKLSLEGRETTFIAPGPKEIGHPNADNMTPTISDLNLSFF